MKHCPFQERRDIYEPGLVKFVTDVTIIINVTYNDIMKWLFLVQQLGAPDSRVRVKIWRLLKKTGALPYRNSVYVLPFNPERLEDFQWICQQIEDSNGEASVFVSEATDEKEDKAIRGLFERDREESYAAVLSSAENLLERVRTAKKQRKPSGGALKELTKESRHLGKAFSEIERIDFFQARIAERVRSVLEQIEGRLDSTGNQDRPRQPVRFYARSAFRNRTWATRERIHIDRLCSAWLIRRFIDPDARFVFVPESELPEGTVQFDVFGAEFGHHGEDCTFETLLKSFRLKDKSLTAIAEIVHDVDIKDGKYGRPEAPGLDAVVRALSDSLKDDEKVLETGSRILDALYFYFSARKRKRK